MESSQFFGNLSTAASLTTTKHNPDFCYPYASVDFETGSSIVPYAVNAALNVLMAIVAILANIMVFNAIRHSTSIRLPSKLLLCSLILTDLGVALVVQPQFATFLITKIKESLDISCFFLKSIAVTGHTLACVSLLTMTAISLDRYIALFFHLKYHEIVTTRRVCVVLAIIWSCSGFFASTLLWNKILLASIAIPGIIVCFVVMSVAYIKIYRGLRHQHGHQVQVQAQVQDQQQTGNTLDLAKYRRSTSSMLGGSTVSIHSVICLSFVFTLLQHFMDTLSSFNASLSSPGHLCSSTRV